MMVAHSLGWVAFCLANRRPHNWLFYTSNLLVYAAGALEIKVLLRPSTLWILSRCVWVDVETSSLVCLGDHGRTCREHLSLCVGGADLSRRSAQDFPPVLGSMDAHAVWHAATPPLSYLFYRFLIADLRWELGLRLDPPLSADKKTE